jgi:hypothetical protein
MGHRSLREGRRPRSGADRDSRFAIGEVLDLNRVLPAAAEVVKLGQRLCADVFKDIADYLTIAGFLGINSRYTPSCQG